MTTLKTGDIAPDFTLEDAEGKPWRLSVPPVNAALSEWPK